MVSPTSTSRSSRALVPTPGRVSTSSPIWAELNHDQERRWQRTAVVYNRQGDAHQLLLFPEDDVSLPDDPNVARVCLDKVSWTNGRRFGDVWLARWLWQLLELDKIVARHLPHNQETVAPADVIAIEVINRSLVSAV
jgi:hypothetical protein